MSESTGLPIFLHKNLSRFRKKSLKVGKETKVGRLRCKLKIIVKVYYTRTFEKKSNC